ncbi:MAG: carboxypeptidase-like regulatory domain-containing protein [Bacteroidetes bacterium]|nr:carboxypeptidase-like regulatory domain-containing protein [Bacteroidota bacterium]
MKIFLNFILLLVICLTGCKINSTKIQTNDTESAIKIDITRNSIPETNFVGHVIDGKTKEPLSGVEVYLKSKNGGKYYGCLTDQEGRFLIENIELGDYVLQITAMDYERAEEKFEIKKHSICRLEVQLFPKVIRLEKPIIYLYPEEKQVINVKINYSGEFIHTYPKYPEDGWTITAEPNAFVG